ncbi:MAG TPA: LysR family transcriptional regulator [Candidatus Choladousia intestinigallinarum]|nr:LysR family transcriptional regulator [Candidatus Choladousia intestinigallinarum]
MDLKQLRCLIACVETGSFSEAAKKLYTTQSSVSKLIKSLEDSLGILIFERMPRGIRLTAQGKKIYHHACRIVSEADGLKAMARRGEAEWLRIAANPSSWFSDQFVDYYNENEEKNYHFQITTAGVRTVMERVRDYLDDMGFVYILGQQEVAFLYEIGKEHLVFEPLHETEIILYPGGSSLLQGKRDRINMKEAAGIRFIQNYQDEFFDIESLGTEDGDGWNGLDISVLTNSDYIMEKMLRKSDVANISGNYLSAGKGTAPGVALDIPDNRVIFGCIFRKGEKKSSGVEALMEFLKSRIQGN